MDQKFKDAVQKRRTFAIISHPDAGKTTLTEKLLLYGGAIREAGSVKSRRSQKHAVSDWMEIEKNRGISVTSSVLQFNYQDYCINILDTPGHQDFSEDTYRTLMAADSAVMVVDCAKGVEEQTKKLFRVCKRRNIPIFTFIDKLDRQGRDPYELLDDIESNLGIRSCPMNWPIGSGADFKGVYNRATKQIERFEGGNHGQGMARTIAGALDDPEVAKVLGTGLLEQLKQDLELLDHAGDAYDLTRIQTGELTPVFFGSALTNFGVEPFLRAFLKMTNPPAPRESNMGLIDPNSDNFTGFIFKIQANMNPAHRDRIAFLRICSGKFDKGMSVYHVQGGKKVKLAQPQQFMAQDRVIVEEAYPGDIIGLHDPGIFKIGDTLCGDGAKIVYEDIPVFSPEHFAKVYAKNTMKRKAFQKGIEQLSEEGAIQIFKKPGVVMEELIIGVVGVLQLEVLEYRLEHEYGVDLVVERLPYHFARWVVGDSQGKGVSLPLDTLLVEDDQGRSVILLQSEWTTRMLEERNKGMTFSEVALR